MMELITESVFYLSKQRKKKTWWKEWTHWGNILRRGTDRVYSRGRAQQTEVHENTPVVLLDRTLAADARKVPGNSFYFCQTALETLLTQAHNPHKMSPHNLASVLFYIPLHCWKISLSRMSLKLKYIAGSFNMAFLG